MLGLDAEPAELVERALALVGIARSAGRRALLGIAGPPAGGKSSLAAWLVARLEEQAPGAVGHVGMDAFHLAEQVLARRGLREVKGAPHTFDPHGYLALLRRLRDDTEHTVYAPVFHRELEESIAHEAEVGPTVRLVITEGNYLLLPSPPWTEVAELLDETWFVTVAEDERLRRLVARHMSYGRSESEARDRAHGSDQANAELILPTAAAADLVITAAAG